MGRWGYAICAVIVVALAVYVFRPDEARSDSVAILSAPLPMEFHLRARGNDQQVKNGMVRTRGLELMPDREKIGALSAFLGNLAVARDRVVEQVGGKDLPAYGIDGASALDFAGGHLEWGVVANPAGERRGYFWNGKAIFATDPALVDHLDELGARLDDQRILPPPGLDRLRVGDLELTRQDNAFICVLQPQRPDFRMRVLALLSLLEGVRLADLDAKLPPAAKRAETLALTYIGEDGARDLALWELDDGGAVQVDELPPQRVDQALFQRLTAAVRDFDRDFLFSIDPQLNANPIDELIVTKAGREWFRVDRRGKQDVRDGRSQWDLRWEQGRENAAQDTVAKVFNAFNRLIVTDVRPCLPIDVAPADAIIITLNGNFLGNTTSLALFNRQAKSPTHIGTIASIDPILAGIAPDEFLDPTLIDRQGDRIVKIQRRFHDEQPQRGEVYTLSPAGAWQQTYPGATPVDQPAVIRLATAIGQARALSVRVATAEDRAIVGKPQWEFAVRCAPRVPGHAHDLVNIDETTALEAGFFCAREGENWRAVDADGRISYLIDDEFAQLLRRPLEDNLVFPAVPALIARVEITTQAEHYSLLQRESHWFVQPDGGEAVACDDVRVRRFLRQLTQARADRVEPQGLLLTQDESLGKVVCNFPEIDEKPQRMTLYVGKPVGGQAPLFAESTRPGAVAKGRHYVAAEQLEWLLPAAASFRP